MKVLIVRAAEDARRTAARLTEAGHQPVVAPVLEIREIDFVSPGGRFDAVVATSGHAFARADRLAEVRSLPLHVVGARTAGAAQAAGFLPPRTVASNASELAKAAGQELAGKRVLYLAGRDRKPDLEAALRPHCSLALVETYAADPADALPVAASDALASRDAAVLHYSQRSAAIFLDLAREAGFSWQLKGLRHIAISRDAAAPLIESEMPVAVAAQPNEDSMIEELARI